MQTCVRWTAGLGVCNFGDSVWRYCDANSNAGSITVRHANDSDSRNHNTITDHNAHAVAIRYTQTYTYSNTYSHRYCNRAAAHASASTSTPCLRAL